MNHYLCSGRRPTAPCTAFSIQLVQYHHLLWQATAVSVSGFIESLSSFLNTWAATPLLNRGSSQKRSHQPPCSDQHKAADNLWNGSTWEKCDNNRLFASKCHHDVPLLMINIYKTGEKLYYLISIIRNLLADFPDSKVGVLYDIGCHLEAHIIKRGLLSDRISDVCFATSVFHAYAHEKLANAEETSQLASDALQILYSTLNPATPGVAYTNTFLKQQWELEKSFHENFNQTREDQRKNLGELLCLQDDLDAAWQRATHTVAQAIVRANTCSDIAKQIVTQQIAIGANQLIDDLTRDQSDLLWKFWHSKTELRQRFLGLVEEKEPLFQVCRSEESTILGTRGNQKLVLAVRKRGDQLCACLESYTKQAQAFITANANDPWAIDINTQRGICILARLKRASKEKQQLGWEAQRAMRWAINCHDQVWSYLGQLCRVTEQSDIPAALQPMLSHQLLSSHQNLSDQLKSAKVLAHSNLIAVSKLQVAWDKAIVAVVRKTTPQSNDDVLLQLWEQQLNKITGSLQFGFLSSIPGDIHDGLLAHFIREGYFPLEP
ncbi:hypothetical protein PTTG_26579 [Puccinia triticina 1-1 BBBD Race 1]|uniref:CxC1 domain-containing protein n=1 Tax=Puccinia triticina (isolate 1-1 / race 1 (BBBD)) TaxID=630390 RepID=A0A180GTY5_PUCT1|nr:hypothetical protein PTTG_26579 [Puccinia triticina 1-1 BBBD Race 1]